MSQESFRYVLASDVANAGTFVIGYPSTSRDAGNYAAAPGHYLSSFKYGTLFHGGLVSFSFGATGATVTNNTGVTLAAGTEFWVNFDYIGVYDDLAVLDPATMREGKLLRLSLGAPDTIDADGICASQSATGAGSCTIDGALASGGVCILDVPRNVVVDSGGADTAVITVTGTDIYGATMVENITLNGTTAVSGLKAFKTITAVSRSATIANGFFMGPGDVLGLPVFLPSTGCVIREMEDGAAPTAGTVVAGVRTAATATTGDVRGTYDPNSAANGSRRFDLIVWVPNALDKGVAQYDG